MQQRLQSTDQSHTTHECYRTIDTPRRQSKPWMQQDLQGQVVGAPRWV